MANPKATILLIAAVLLLPNTGVGSQPSAPYVDLMKEEVLVGSREFSFTVDPAVEPGERILICFRGHFAGKVDGYIAVNHGTPVEWKNESRYYSLNIGVNPGRNSIKLGVRNRDRILVQKAWIVGCEGTVSRITAVKAED